MANKVNGGGQLDQMFKAYNAASDGWAKDRDEAYKSATTFGIGPIRLPRGPFSNQKAIQDAEERLAKLQASANNAFEILKEALVRSAGRGN